MRDMHVLQLVVEEASNSILNELEGHDCACRETSEGKSLGSSAGVA